MAKKIVKNLSDVKDSKLLYEKDLPPFGYWIIIAVAIFLIGLIVWSTTAHKTYIIKGSGNVVSDNKNYIMSDYTGQIKEMNIEEGAYVESGDTLFVVKSTDLELQTTQIEEKIAVYQQQISQYQKLEKAIKDNENYFSSTKEEDKLYYNKFLEYRTKIEQTKIDLSQYKSYGYTDQQIAEEVKKNDAKAAQIYYETLSTIASAILEFNGQIDDLKIQQKAVNDGKSDYHIVANASGIVHMLADYKEGMVVQAASTIGSIASENDVYYISAYIPADNMPLIKEGQAADIAVAGLTENTYGTLEGEVLQIDSDITTDGEKGESYYKVKVRPKEEYLISKAGNKVNLSNGMAVEIRVKYDEITYFQYVLESLGVLVR